jgi:hypothetical protein
MAEGTSIASLETGNVADKADNALMSQILEEIGNAGGAVKTAGGGTNVQHVPLVSPPMGGIPTYSPHEGMHAPPASMVIPPPGYMYHQMPQYQGNQGNSYDDEDEEEMQQVRRKKIVVKKNFASSLLEFIRDPFFVGIILIVLSLPVLHTNVGKYVPSMYSAGGMLSWIGLVGIGAIGAVLFILFRTISNLLGL